MYNIERKKLSDKLTISRVLTGLWQVADMERGGTALDTDIAADHLQAYANSGFTTFDMADHYGSAEIIAGQLLSRYRNGETRPVASTNGALPPVRCARNCARWCAGQAGSAWGGSR